MWQICLQFFLRFRENLVSLSHHKGNQENVGAQLNVVWSNLQNCRAVKEQGESNWSRKICFTLELFLFVLCCDWLKPLLYVAKCLCCRTQLGRWHGFWKSPGDSRVCFSLWISRAKAVIYWPGRDYRSDLPTFCTSYNNQISDTWWELCKDS